MLPQIYCVSLELPKKMMPNKQKIKMEKLYGLKYIVYCIFESSPKILGAINETNTGMKISTL